MREHHRNRLIVIERQRCFDSDPPLDCVRDPTSGLGVALTCQSLRKQTSNGRSHSYACNAHRSTLPDKTGQDQLRNTATSSVLSAHLAVKA